MSFYRWLREGHICPSRRHTTILFLMKINTFLRNVLITRWIDHFVIINLLLQKIHINILTWNKKKAKNTLNRDDFISWVMSLDPLFNVYLRNVVWGRFEFALAQTWLYRIIWEKLKTFLVIQLQDKKSNLEDRNYLYLHRIWIYIKSVIRTWKCLSCLHS